MDTKLEEDSNWKKKTAIGIGRSSLHFLFYKNEVYENIKAQNP